jgi:hypothetical protein
MTYSNASDHLDKESQQDQGSFFTPQELALEMASKIIVDKNSKIIDPCIGRANLFKALKELHPELDNSQFFGLDIDAEAIRLNKEDPELQGMNFQVGNVLEDDIEDYNFWYDRERYDAYHTKIKNLEQEIVELKQGIITKNKEVKQDRKSELEDEIKLLTERVGNNKMGVDKIKLEELKKEYKLICKKQHSKNNLNE